MRRLILCLMLLVGLAAPAAAVDLVDPPNLIAYRDYPAGTVLSVTLTGKTGWVLGNQVYADESDPAIAAVHVGLLRAGETRTVDIVILGPIDLLSDGSQNGVSAGGGIPADGSYTFQAVIDAGDAWLDTGNMYQFTFRAPDTYKIVLTGRTDQSIWGDGYYTYDSWLATAAVHAGVLQPGETKTLEVQMVGDVQAFSGSLRNGVTSQKYDVKSQAYIFVAAPPTSTTIDVGPSGIRLQNYRSQVGLELDLRITGDKDLGRVWGTGLYTDDSAIASAAVHAGLLGDGETGVVTIRIKGGTVAPDAFVGSDQYGVVSESYPSGYPGSYEFVGRKE